MPRPESEATIKLMNRIDEIFTNNLDYRRRMMRKVLIREDGLYVNRKRIRRLMQKMGICAIYPGKNISKPGKGLLHKIYPYLLRHLSITVPIHVWCTDITYIRMKRGFIYLVAVMDWGTKKILSWEISQSLDNRFYVSALKPALAQRGPAKSETAPKNKTFVA